MKGYWHSIEQDLEAQDALGVVIWIWTELRELNRILKINAEFTEKHGL